jgi:hypothetical protein
VLKAVLTDIRVAALIEQPGDPARASLLFALRKMARHTVAARSSAGTGTGCQVFDVR